MVARQKVNEVGRKIGNLVYDGLGDFLADTEVTPRWIGTSLALLVAGAGVLSSVACENMTPQQKRNLEIVGGTFGALTQVSPYATPSQRALGAGIGTAAQMSHQETVAREGRSEVNVVDGATDYNGNSYREVDRLSNEEINRLRSMLREEYRKRVRTERERDKLRLLLREEYRIKENDVNGVENNE